MAQTSEAACLLQTGAQYTRRLGLRDGSGRLVFAGQKRGVFSLYFDDELICHFDLEGRWQRAYVAGLHYRKALDAWRGGTRNVTFPLGTWLMRVQHAALCAAAC